MKEYRPIKVPNPFTNYYIFGGVFLCITIFSLIEDSFRVKSMMLGITAALVVIAFFIIRTVKYTVLLRFEDNSLRIEYLDYRKRPFFMQISYFELSSKISVERAKSRTYQVLNIVRNGKIVIRIDETNSNFSRQELSKIHEDILEINPSNG